MPASADPDKRQRQLANLRQNAATKHGSHSEATLRPLREHAYDELAREYGAIASEHELRLAADRKARLQAIREWLDQHGVIADRRTGKPRPVLQTAERLEAVLERQLRDLDRQLRDLRERGGGTDSAPYGDPTVMPYIELELDERIGLLADDAEIRRAAAKRILRRISDERRGRLVWRKLGDTTTAPRSDPIMTKALSDLTDEELEALHRRLYPEDAGPSARSSGKRSHLSEPGAKQGKTRPGRRSAKPAAQSDGKPMPKRPTTSGGKKR